MVNSIHRATIGLLLLRVPIASPIGCMLPQTLRSTLSDPDDRSEIESGNDGCAQDEYEDPGNLHVR